MNPVGEICIATEDGRRVWAITAQPHVMIRLRRIFCVTRGHMGTLRLPMTDQNARELRWVTDLFPLAFPNPADEAVLHARADAHVQRLSEVEALLAGRHTPPVGERALAVPPRPYQLEAARLLLAARSLLLADDVGLGKTCSAIATLTDPRTLPALVVTLTHLPLQWCDELARFAPWLRVHVVKSGTPYDLRAPRRRPRRERERAADGQLGLLAPEALERPWPDVIVINYHKLAGWADTLAGVCKLVVFDEVQELRRAKGSDGIPTARYAAARQIASRAEFRLGLSATPIYNYGDEIHAVIDVLSPDALGTRAEFMAEWGGGGERMLKDPAAFGTFARSQGLMLRRTRASVGRELPAVQRLRHHCDADLAELDKVSASVAELAAILLRDVELTRGDKMRASEEISWKLRHATGLGKARFVAEFVKLLLESESKVVLYGWHRDVYEVWRLALQDYGPVMYTGEESVTQKAAAKRAFVESPECRVMLISLRSGAGLDGLQHVCRTVVFAELDWSPGVHEQCIGRVARDGQKEPVVAYFLVSDHGADPVMADVLQVKEAQAEGVTDPEAPSIENLQVDPDRIKKLAADYLRQRGGTGQPAEPDDDERAAS